MNISPANLSIPVVAASVNPQTEQVARDNRAHEQIIAPKKVNETQAETAVNLKEKRMKKPFGDLSDSPHYQQEPKQKQEESNQQSDDEKHHETKEQRLTKAINSEIDKKFAASLIEPINQSPVAERYQQAVQPTQDADFDFVI